MRGQLPDSFSGDAIAAGLSRRHVLLALAGAAGSVLGLAACGGSPATTTGTAATVSTAPIASAAVASTTATTAVAASTASIAAAATTTASAASSTLAATTATAATSAAIASTTVPAAAAGGTKAAVTLSFWKGPHRADEATAVAGPTFAKFTDAYPNIHVDFLAVAWGDYTTKFGAAFAGGTPPDLSYQTESFPTYVNGNDILALDALMQTSKFDRNFFYPQLWDVCTYSGKTYAVPWVNGGSCLFWNKTLFEQVGLDPKTPPNTMDEFVTSAQKLTRAGANPTYGFSTGATDTHENGQWPRRWGGHWFDAQRTKCIVDSSEATAGFQFLYDLFYKSQVAMPFALQGKAGNSFQDGNVGMITGQTALVSTIRKKNPNLQFGLARVPKGPAPEPMGRAAYGGAGLLAIAKDSKYTPEAWTLAQWMVTPAALDMYVGKGLGFMSVAPKVNFYADDPILTAGQSTLQYTVFWPYKEWIFKFWDIESKGIGAFLTQKTSVDDGVKAMTALVNGMLQQQGKA